VSEAALTDVGHWDDSWAGTRLPQEIVPGRRANEDAIAAVFDSYAPREGTALELGGAVGAWSAYVARRGCRVTVLDYSPTGIDLTRRNFSMLDIDGEVTVGDMFDADDRSYDFVFSLGLIEHFDDLDLAIAAHVRRVKPGGLMLLGCPNFRGINRPLVGYLTPARLAEHNLETMDVNTWPRFERKFGLTPLFRGYVGGFEPRAHRHAEGRRLDKRIVARGMWILSGALNLHALRRLRPNGPRTSGYCMAVYRVQGAP
jgi:2-polyprenyl-3-methyl-5-hydroxy-6-metoxy-1,4-benzoquinol methylase